MQSNIKVAVRIRDIEGIELPFQYTDDNIQVNKTNFKFDKIYGPSTQNQQIFDDIITQQLQIYFQGYSSTIFAYGQSGSGKSYTMLSNNDSIIQLTVNTLLKQQKKYTIAVIELYNEQLRDLLDVANIDLKITQDKKGNVFIEGVTKQNLATSNDFMLLLKTVQRNRSVGYTDLNAHSSRSHLIVIIAPGEVDPQKPLGPNINTGNMRNQLFLIDLAGSERVSKTNATGQTLSEGTSINYSLLILGRVIQAVVQRSPYIPFRDSKLARIVQPALGNSASCQLIVCISPLQSNLEESVQSLRFGVRCSNVINILQKQTSQKTQSIDQLKAENDELRTQLTQREGEVADLKNFIDELETKYWDLRAKSKELLVKTIEEKYDCLSEIQAETRKMIDDVYKIEQNMRQLNNSEDDTKQKSRQNPNAQFQEQSNLSEDTSCDEKSDIVLNTQKMKRIRFQNV